MGALLRLLLTAGVACGGLLLAARYLKRRGVTPAAHGLSVVTRYPTGKGSALLVVHAGTKVLLVGQAPGGFACLAELGELGGVPEGHVDAAIAEAVEGAAMTPAAPAVPGAPSAKLPLGVALGQKLAARMRASAPAAPAAPAGLPVEAVAPLAPNPAAVPVVPTGGHSTFDVVIGEGPVLPAALGGPALAAPRTASAPMVPVRPTVDAVADRHAVSVEQLDDEDLHRVLLEIDARTVLIAIKGAPAGFAERIGNCFVGGDADRRAALVSCAVNLAGKSFTEPEIRDARRQIAAKARSLVAFGEITVRPPHGGDAFAALLADAARNPA